MKKTCVGVQAGGCALQVSVLEGMAFGAVAVGDSATLCAVGGHKWVLGMIELACGVLLNRLDCHCVAVCRCFGELTGEVRGDVVGGGDVHASLSSCSATGPCTNPHSCQEIWEGALRKGQRVMHA